MRSFVEERIVLHYIHFVVCSLLLPIQSIGLWCTLAARLRTTLTQTATKSHDTYQPIASLYFLVSKLQFSDGLINLVQRKTI